MSPLTTERLRELVDLEHADPMQPRPVVVLPEPTLAERKRAEDFVRWMRGLGR